MRICENDFCSVDSSTTRHQEINLTLSRAPTNFTQYVIFVDHTQKRFLFPLGGVLHGICL